MTKQTLKRNLGRTGQLNTHHFAFILRAWCEKMPNGRCVWRFSLEDTLTQQRRGFGTVEEMSRYLREKTDPSPPE